MKSSGWAYPAPPATSVVKVGDREFLTYVRNQSYRVSFVDAWGAEEPLSDPSLTHEIGIGGKVQVTLPAVPQAITTLALVPVS